MTDRVDESLRGARFHLLLTGLSAVVAIVLASVGIYGVTSFVSVEVSCVSSSMARRAQAVMSGWSDPRSSVNTQTLLITMMV
jgi:hypothetical protein